MRELPEFSGLPSTRIHLVENAEQVSFARKELSQHFFVGFDTESKPTFTSGERNTGPHLVQLATMEHAFLFQIPEQDLIDTHAVYYPLLAEILQSDHIVKVGFGLKSDRKPVWRKLALDLNNTLELATAVKRLGYQQQVGLQAAVAMVLSEYLPKSKKQTLSNWAAERLTREQLHYAANDAYASLWVYLIMKRWAPELL